MENFIKTTLHDDLDKLLSNNLKVEIIDDEGAWHPRDDDTNGGIICVRNNCRYLRNEESAVDFDRDNFKNWLQVATWLRTEKNAVEVLPIFVYEHSGITINTTGFCRSGEYGQIGVYYTTAKRFKEYISDDLDIKNIRRILKLEIDIYDRYLKGEVYAYKITNKMGRTIEYAGSYYDYNEAKTEGNNSLENLQKQYDSEVLHLKHHMSKVQELPFISA